MSDPLVKVIRTAVTSRSRRIGEDREAIEAGERGARLLQEHFPLVQCETALDGARIVPLREIEQIVKHCQQREQKAREDGFNSGQAAGLEEGRAEAKKVFDSFSGAVNAAVQQRESILQDAEKNAMDVILKIARKVTCNSAKVDLEVTAAIIKGAIGELADKREIVVKVNPDHFKELECRIEEFKELSTDIRKLRLEPDARIGFGGCFIHTPSGDIDARLESQLDVLEETIQTEAS